MATLRCIMEGLKINQALLQSSRSAITDGGGLASAAFVGSAVAACIPFALKPLIGVDGRILASCDAGPTFPFSTDEIFTSIRTASETILRHDTLNDKTKEYSIELKPIFSAFQMRPLTLTIIRSFLLFYLPLLQPKIEDDDDFLPNEEHPVDLVVPFKNSVKQIIREVSVVTTRRVLERFVVYECSQRTAWKLLKDVPTSALRKSDRGMPFYTYTFCVGKTTFRGHFLGVAASWLVQVGIECYRCVRDITKTENEGEDVDIVVYKGERTKVLGKRVCGITVRCGASLVFASIGAGLGATLLRPKTGQSLGCLLGDMVGPIIVSLCLANVPQLEL